MVTAADGASEYYTLENNPSRYEKTLEIAIEVDRKLQNAWSGHPHLTIVDNSEKGFENKIRKVINAVEKTIGAPTAHEFYKKFLVEWYDFK